MALHSALPKTMCPAPMLLWMTWELCLPHKAVRALLLLLSMSCSGFKTMLNMVFLFSKMLRDVQLVFSDVQVLFNDVQLVFRNVQFILSNIQVPLSGVQVELNANRKN